MENQEIIRLQNIAVSFDGEKVLDDFSLSIRNGEFVTLPQPEGPARTTNSPGVTEKEISRRTGSVCSGKQNVRFWRLKIPI